VNAPLRITGAAYIPPTADRTADAAATDAGTVERARALIAECSNALKALSETSFRRNPDGHATDAVGDAVAGLEDVAAALSIAGIECDERENDALLAFV
jgi:hypothetical protein